MRSSSAPSAAPSVATVASAVLDREAADIDQRAQHVGREAHALFVGEGGDRDRTRRLEARGAQRLDRLEARQHAVAAVVDAGVDDGVDMRADQDRRGIGALAAAPDAEEIADAVARVSSPAPRIHATSRSRPALSASLAASRVSLPSSSRPIRAEFAECGRPGGRRRSTSRASRASSRDDLHGLARGRRRALGGDEFAIAAGSVAPSELTSRTRERALSPSAALAASLAAARIRPARPAPPLSPDTIAGSAPAGRARRFITATASSSSTVMKASATRESTRQATWEGS